MAPPSGFAVNYAGVFRRLVAYCADAVITAVLFVAMSFFVIRPIFLVLFRGLLSRGVSPRDIWAVAEPWQKLTSGLILLGAATAVSAIYSAGLEQSSKQATWGKQALGLVVTDIHGRRISVARAAARWFVKVLTSALPLLPLVSLLTVIGGKRKQALHDMLCETLVLRR